MKAEEGPALVANAIAATATDRKPDDTHKAALTSAVGLAVHDRGQR